MCDRVGLRSLWQLSNSDIVPFVFLWFSLINWYHYDGDDQVSSLMVIHQGNCWNPSFLSCNLGSWHFGRISNPPTSYWFCGKTLQYGNLRIRYQLFLVTWLFTPMLELCSHEGEYDFGIKDTNSPQVASDPITHVICMLYYDIFHCLCQ